MNTKVLFVNPPTPQYLPNKEFIPPTSLLSLAAVVRKEGYQARLLDLNIFKPWTSDTGYEDALNKKLIEVCEEYNPDIVGVGCLFSGQFHNVLHICQTVKQLQPNITTVTGGIHPTIHGKKINENSPWIDYVVIGEGEIQMLEIANCVETGSDPRDDVDGIAYTKNGRHIYRDKTSFITDLDALPLPAYDLIDFSDYYHPTDHWHNPKGLDIKMTMPIVSSRSCPMRCSFCSMYLVMGPKIRARSPENVADEMELLYTEYGHRHFSFMDDNINCKKSHILELCNQIKKRNMDIEFETPSGLMISTLDREVVEAMIEVGWVRGAIAIESGSDYIRNQVMGKRLRRDKIEEVVGLLKEYKDLFLKAYFIIGMPEETPETLMETYAMIENLQFDDPYVTNILPFPGTRVFEQAMRDGLLIEEMDMEALWNKDGFHCTDNKKFYIKPYGMTLEELQDFRTRFDDLLERNRARVQNERLKAA